MKNIGSIFGDFVRSIAAVFFMTIGILPVIFVVILAGVAVFFLYYLVTLLI